MTYKEAFEKDNMKCINCGKSLYNDCEAQYEARLTLDNIWYCENCKHIHEEKIKQDAEKA